MGRGLSMGESAFRGVYLQRGRGVCLKRGLGRPPPEPGKWVVGILLKCFLVLFYVHTLKTENTQNIDGYVCHTVYSFGPLI